MHMIDSKGMSKCSQTKVVTLVTIPTSMHGETLQQRGCCGFAAAAAAEGWHAQHFYLKRTIHHDNVSVTN